MDAIEEIVRYIVAEHRTGTLALSIVAILIPYVFRHYKVFRIATISLGLQIRYLALKAWYLF